MGMNDTTITTERVDDVPLLLAHMQHMGLADAIDAHAHPHGNRQGLSFGWLAVLWLTHILSQADHRMNQVRSWAMHLVTTLTALLPQPWQPTDLTDDRLADLLRVLSDDQVWTACETTLNQHLVRAYDLDTLRVRLDSTSSSGHWTVTPDSLFQFGHSKDHRPDLPQLKAMLATLDPLGMPVAVDVLPGNRADDGAYLPIIQRVQTTLQPTGVLYIGDSKLPALATRATIHQSGNFYLAPLNQVQLPLDALHAWVDAVLVTPLELQPIWRTDATGQMRLIALGTTRQVTQRTTLEGQSRTWAEQQWLVCSLTRQRAQQAALQQRLTDAETALTTLLRPGRGRRCPPTPDALTAAVAAILTRYAVQGLLAVTVQSQAHTRTKRAWGDRPAQTVTTYDLTLTVTRQTGAIAQAEARMGWRVYVSNQTVEHLSLELAVVAYREEYLIERGFQRLKGAPLSLRPWYVSRADHATGLLRLLSLGLRVLTVLEHGIRQQVQQAGQPMAGLYADQPKRTTMRPTAEAVLRAFRHVTLTVIRVPGQCMQHLTPLSALQHQLLALARMEATCYGRLNAHSVEPPGK